MLFQHSAPVGEMTVVVKLLLRDQAPMAV